MQFGRKIDDQLNSITMYRLLLYGLGLLAAVGVAFAYMGALSLSGTALLVSLAVLLTTCYAANFVLRRVWHATTNTESSLITALILFFILPPADSLERGVAIAIAGIMAMASKYVLAWRAKHIFNPAAIAAVAIGLTGLVNASWWVGSSDMLPFTLILGLLITRKTRRFRMLFSFVLASLLVLLLVGMINGQAATDILKDAFTVWPLVFLGTIMLTEPATTPPRNTERIVYGALVGVIFTSQLHIGSISSTPEIALVIGNLFSYAVSPRFKSYLRFMGKTNLAPNIYEFVFKPAHRFTFLPGQYIEATLGHTHTDDRGNRRTFTIASSPTESEIHLGIKFYIPGSSFKKALLALKPNAHLVAGQLAGDFTLPSDTQQKLVFIGGGIGITPYRSMLQYLVDENEQRSITLLYSAKTTEEFVYKDVLEQAEQKLGTKIVYVLSDTTTVPRDWRGQTGFITADMLRAEVPDFHERLFYIAGPVAMVNTAEHELRKLGVPTRHIKTDFFAGY